MQYDVRYFDVNQQVANGHQPVIVISRPLMHGTDPKGGVFNQAKVARRGEYYVPQNRFFEGPLKFVLTRQGELVRIPMWDYPTDAPAISAAGALCLQMGIELTSQALQEIQTTTNKPVTKALIVMGHEWHSIVLKDGNPGLRGYVGVALVVDD